MKERIMHKRTFYVDGAADTGLMTGNFLKVRALSAHEALAQSGVSDHNTPDRIYARVWGGGEKTLYRYSSGRKNPDKVIIVIYWGGCQSH
jgi:hypothetical protein